VLYETGRGLAPDPIEAMIWYQSAADQDLAAAQYRLGTIALAGADVPSNPAEAARWFKRAAEQGVVGAQYALAGLYERGDGIAASPREAYGWYNLAAAAGHPDAQAGLARVAATLAAERLGEARRYAAALAARLAPLAGAAASDGSERPGGLILTQLPSRAPGAPSRAMMSEIQRLLGAAGYDPGPVDGLVGDLTAQAIRKYKLDAGIAVDSVADARLLSRLRAAAGPPPAASQP
jgi:localization factor PodJL